MTEEQWRPVPGYEGLYEVSDQGGIKSTRRKGSAGGILKTPIDPATGYPKVGLYRDGRGTTKAVHQIVAAAFLGPTPEGQEIRHMDGNRQNNRFGNLMHGTSRENKLDMILHGTHTNANKTHCKNGHPFDEANTYIIRVSGSRSCRVCHRAVSTEWARARRERRARS